MQKKVNLVIYIASCIVGEVCGIFGLIVWTVVCREELTGRQMVYPWLGIFVFAAYYFKITY